MTAWAMLPVAALLLASARADAASAKRAAFGTLPDGRVVEAVTIIGANGASVRIPYGATLQALYALQRSGKVADVTLGYADLDRDVRRPAFRAQTVGHRANRIADRRSCATAGHTSCR